jgi:hypothetical protein
VTLRHDLAIHKFADRDGAHIEATGRAPLQFEATIPFINTIATAGVETWHQPLYPAQFRKFVKACADKSTKKLQHPEFGLIDVKCEEFSTDWDGAKRGGVEVHVRWIESTDKPDDLRQILADDSPAAALTASCRDLDLQVAAARTGITSPALPIPGQPPPVFQPSAPHLPVFSTSFSQFAMALRGVFDQVTLFQKRIGGAGDNIVYQANAIQQSLDRSSNALNWPIQKNCYVVKAAVSDLRQTILQKNKDVIMYVVPGDTTLAGIAAATGADVVDLMKLNKNLSSSPVIVKGTIVRYYADPKRA